MPFYSFAITVPANTAQTAPVELEAPLSPGMIHRVEIQFPRGCAGLAHAQVFRAAHQIWPTNLDEDLASDGFIIAWDDRYELAESPYSLILRAWNLDDTYQHIITFRFAILPAAVFTPAAEAVGMLTRIGRLLFGG